MHVVSVLIEHPIRHLDTHFDYLSDKEVPKGVRVIVPFSHQQVTGYVIGCLDEKQSEQKIKENKDFNYKEIIRIIDDVPLLNEELDQLSISLSKMTFSPRISCIKAMLPPALKPSSGKKTGVKRKILIFYKSTSDKLTKKQEEVLNIIKKNSPIFKSDLSVSDSIIKTLELKKCIELKQTEVYREIDIFQSKDVQVKLNKYQVNAVNFICHSHDSKPILLYGITGSGKTEVY